MNLKQCYNWFKRFKEDRMSVGEDTRPGRPSTSKNDDHIERFRAVTRGNIRLTVREVAEEVGIGIVFCHQMFTDKLQMRRFSNSPVHASLLIRSYLAKQQIYVCAPSTLFSGLNPSRLYPVSQT
jgi:hypothetical protein